MSTREIQGHLEEMYSYDVSPALISQVTDAVQDEVRAWQSRPLDIQPTPSFTWTLCTFGCATTGKCRTALCTWRIGALTTVLVPVIAPSNSTRAGRPDACISVADVGNLSPLTWTPWI